MISEVVMPQMGADMTEGTLVRWLKAEGDAVERGDIIAEIETDKANVEIEAFESGVFRKALAAEGDVVPVGGLIGVIAGAGEDISSYEARGAKADGTAAAESPFAGEAVAAPPPPVQTAPAPDPGPSPGDAPSRPSAPSPAPPAARTGEARVRISPVARRLAEDAGIDVRTLTGSGPDGRIIKRDVEAAARGGRATCSQPAAAPAGAEAPSVVKPSKMRQAIARRMSQSKRDAPHYYLLVDVDMTDALEMRRQYNEAIASRTMAAASGTKASINDLLIRAVALALRAHPAFNATIDGGGSVTRHPRQNVCIGIALDDGLIAPALLDAAARSLAEISAASDDLIARAKGGSLRPAELSEGTFTITNLGAYGVEALVGIIQPPQTAILGAGSVLPQAAVRDGSVVARQMMKLALSADHRVTDGAEGARFLAEIKRLLETPLSLVL